MTSFQFISLLTTILATAAIIGTTLIVNARKARKREAEESNKVRTTLLIGQATIMEKMSGIEHTLELNNKFFEDLFDHKEDNLKQPGKCALVFVTKEDLRNINK